MVRLEDSAREERLGLAVLLVAPEEEEDDAKNDGQSGDTSDLSTRSLWQMERGREEERKIQDKNEQSAERLLHQRGIQRETQK